MNTERCPRALKKDWKKWKLVIDSRTYTLQHYWDQREYSKEFWRSEEACCHPDSNEKPPVKIGVRGGREVASIEDSVDASIQLLGDYIEKHGEGLITVIRNDTDNTKTNRMTITRKQKWEVKQLHRRFKRLISNLDVAKQRNLKRKTESLQIAAQNNAIRTNHIKARIDKTQQNRKCRLCGDRNEMINYKISKCSKSAQKEYKIRNAWVGKVIHWELCKKKNWPRKQVAYV